MLKNNIKVENALSISLDFEQKLQEKDLDFKIHSIYNKVLNLYDNQNNIYTIALKSIDNAPHTLRINSDQSFQELDIDKSDQIYFNNKQLFISNKLMIKVKDCKIFDSQIKSRIRLNKEVLIQNLKECFVIINNKGKFGGAKYFYQKRFTENNEYDNPGIIEKEFAERIEKYILVEEKEIEKIIGFGMGLTPTGDDFLLGYFMTAALIEDKYSQKVFKDLKSKLEKIYFSTTDLSREMLLRALELKLRENIRNLIFSLNKSSKQSKFHLKEVLEIGSSSGTDITVGILTAYQEILSKHENGG